MPRARLAAAYLTGTMALTFSETGTRAHHSIAGAYDAKKPVTVAGTVHLFHFVNPHPWLEVDALDAGGQANTWRMEMDNRSELVAVGMDAGTLRPGDRIVVSGIAAVMGQYSLYVRKLERPDGLRYEQKGAVPVFTPPR
jgi:uncharacterized protein DUF6152